MAESSLYQPRATKALQKIQHQLTCRVCRNHYTRPRTLPCLHSFCNACIANFPETIQEGTRDRLIACPVCRQLATVQQDIAKEFPASFLVEYFLEIHDLLQKVAGHQVICDNCHREQATRYCKQCDKLGCQACIDMHNQWEDFRDHQTLSLTDVIDITSNLIPLKDHPTKQCSRHGKPLNVYCDTCSKLICQLCNRHHYGHHCQPLSKALPAQQQQIENRLQQVKKNLAIITTATQTLESHEENFLEHVQAVKTEIENTVQQQIELLKESETKLMIELEQIAQEYSDTVSTRKDEANISISRLKSCKEFAEEELRIGNQQEILQTKKQLMKRMKTVCSQVKDNDFQPPEQPAVEFEKNSSLCHNLGTVVRSNQPAAYDNYAIFTPPNGIFPKQFSQVPADSKPNILLQKARKSFRCLYDPCGIVCTEGHLIVVEEGRHCITIINIANRKVIRKIGQQGKGEYQFSSPEGVSLTQDGHIVVADSSNHRLQLFTKEGTFISSVGSKGTKPLQFKKPWAIAVDPHTGKIFVTERESNRVQVLNSDLSYSHRFGRKGEQPGYFNKPSGIAIDSEGTVYVADHDNNRVQMFTPKGKIIAVIDSKDDEMLSSPYGVCVDSKDVLYVTELHRNTVCVFDSSGQFLGYIGDSDGSSFKYPRYITLDNHGTVYISDDYGVTPY